MPWTNQSGGGPWKPGGPRPGPWGQGPGGATPPDLEDLIRKSQDRLRNLAPRGGMGGLGLLGAVLAVVLIWLLSGFYTVGPNEVGINLLFGRYTGKTQAGLNYNLPYPIGEVQKLAVTDRNAIDIGNGLREERGRGGSSSVPDPQEDGLMLTGDENIADVKFRVIWQIDPEHPEFYAFNIRNPNDTVKAVSESAMREVIGRSQIQKILTSERKVIEPTVQDLIQRVLNDYHAGILILQVQLLSVDPPAQVIAAFRDVTAAQQDLQRARNEAEAYANRVVPEARGAAASTVQLAEGDKEQMIRSARGQASRFDQVYAQYRNAPDITRQRMYIETMESVLSGADKTIIDEAGRSVLPILPLTGSPAPAPSAGAKP